MSIKEDGESYLRPLCVLRFIPGWHDTLEALSTHPDLQAADGLLDKGGKVIQNKLLDGKRPLKAAYFCF